jgi:hypothetical protein
VGVTVRTFLLLIAAAGNAEEGVERRGRAKDGRFLPLLLLLLVLVAVVEWEKLKGAQKAWAIETVGVKVGAGL